MKRILTVLLMLVSLVSCSAGAEITPEEIERISGEETYPDGMYSLAVTFSTLEEIYVLSDLVIAGEVTQSETVMLDAFPQTRSSVTVKTVLKGEGTERTVLVREEAAMTVPLMEVGQKVLLFLVETGLSDSEGEYYIAGAFQGKFICREELYFQQATEGVKLSLEAYYPSTLEEITERLCSEK